MTITTFVNGQTLYAPTLNNDFGSCVAKDGTDSTMTGELSWNPTINGTAQYYVQQAGTTTDNRINNTQTEGGAYISGGGIDFAVQNTYNLEGQSGNSYWQNNIQFNQYGGGDGVANGQGNIVSYLQLYGADFPLYTTSITSATPSGAVHSVVLTDVSGFGLAYPSAQNAPDGGLGGGSCRVSTAQPLSVQFQSGAIGQIIGCSGNALDPVLGPTGPGTIVTLGTISIADATNGALVTNGFLPTQTLASFYGYIAGNTLTVTQMLNAGTLGLYMYLATVNNSVYPISGTYISGLGTGTTGVGTYTVPISQTIGSSGAVAQFTVCNYRMASEGQVPFVIENRDFGGRAYGLGPIMEAIEVDNEALGSGGGQRKAMGHFFQTAMGFGYSNSTYAPAVNVISVSVPTWFQYYRQLQVPQIGYHVFGNAAFASGTTATNVIYTGLTGSGGFGAVNVYANYTIQLSANTVGTLYPSNGVNFAPSLTSNFTNSLQIGLLDSGVTLDYPIEIFGPGTIGVSVLDTTNSQLVMASGAAVVRAGLGQTAVAYGTSGQSNYASIAQVGGTNADAMLQALTRNSLTGYLDFGNGYGPPLTIGTTSTLTATEFGSVIKVVGTGPYTITLPSAVNVPAGRGFSFIGKHSGVVTLTTSSSQVLEIPNLFTGSFSILPSDTILVVSDGANWEVPQRTNASTCGPFANVATLTGWSLNGGDVGRQGYASNGRNTGEGSGSGTGCPVFVKLIGGTPTWCAIWSGVLVTS
jgi:hypothetical protein